jgi:group I intron endonuclease
MERHIIYKLTSPSGKIYIGRTANYKKRLIDHEYQAKNGVQRPLYKAIRKHGWEAFTKEKIATVLGKELAAATELHYIQHFNSIAEGYNVSSHTEGGGDNWDGRRDTPEYDDFLKRMRVINNSGRMHGKSHTAEAKEKQKSAAKGRYTLQWFQDRHGIEEGERLYVERCSFLKTRKLTKDTNGRFAK